MSSDPRLLCRCAVRPLDGSKLSRCPRRATAEDGLCDHCRSCGGGCGEGSCCCTVNGRAVLLGPEAAASLRPEAEPAPF